MKKYLPIFIALMILSLSLTFFVYAQDGLLIEEPSNTESSVIAQKFVNQINSLNGVDLNANIFNNPVFQSLVDFSRPIPEESKGRNNPFAPI